MPDKPEKNYRTLAIRLDDTLHQQILLVAQLDGVTLVDAIRQAIQAHITAKRGEGDLAARAAEALAAIDEETANRRRAIEELFGSRSNAGTTDATSSSDEPPAAEAPVPIDPAKSQSRRKPGVVG